MGLYDVTIRKKSTTTKSGFRQEIVMLFAESENDAKKKAIRDYRVAGAKNPKVIKVRRRL